MMVRLAPDRVSDRPMTDGSPLNRDRQNPSLMMTTAGPPSVSSAAVDVRPNAGATPMTVKNRGEVRIAATRSGSAPVVSVMFSKYVPASPVNDRFARFHSSMRTGASRVVWPVSGRRLSSKMTQSIGPG